MIESRGVWSLATELDEYAWVLKWTQWTQWTVFLASVRSLHEVDSSDDSSWIFAGRPGPDLVD